MLTGLPSIGFPFWLPNMGTDRPAAWDRLPGSTSDRLCFEEGNPHYTTASSQSPGLFILIPSSLGRALPFPSEERASNVSH